MTKIPTLIFTVFLVVSSASGANLLSNPGFESFASSINDAVLSGSGYYAPADYTSPVTVDSGDANFTGFIGTWAGTIAGDGMTSAVVGTGNDSNRVTANRKGGRYIQILALDTISNGDTLQVDWRYGVDAAYVQDLSFQIEVFALNQATGGEAATTFTGGLSFGGETFNSSILTTQVVSLDYDAGDTANDDIDGIWHAAPTTFVNITEDWDYVGIAIKRTGGQGNVTNAQTDDVSIQIVPEPSTLVMFSGALVLFGLRFRRRRG